MPAAYNQKEDFEGNERWRFLDERLRVVEGIDRYGVDAVDLCLVPDVVLPTDFKVPDFDKYRGSTCPITHLAMYCRKMAVYVQDDKILVHCFQDSLSGVALSWYVNLEKGRIRTWKDLAEAFLKQYKYNEEMASDRSRLQNMAKKDHEGFKVYAQQWRELAAQVQPPLIEKEMVYTFIDTLPSPFYEIVVGSVSSSFTDLVIIGERVEVGLKRGKKATQERKKGEENVVIANTTSGYGRGKPLHIQASKERLGTSPATPLYLPYQTADTMKTNVDTNAKPVNRRSNPRVLDPVPVPYIELFRTLLEKKLISIIPLKPAEPSYSKSYDPDTRCEYHGGVIEYPTERCWGLKHKVQDLIDEGWLVFQKKGLNIKNNPLPEHGSTAINLIEHEQLGGELVEARDEEIAETPLRVFHTTLRMEEGAHRVETSTTDVATIGEDEHPPPKSLVICYNPTSQARVLLVIPLPEPQYTDSHVVPPKYLQEEMVPRPKENEEMTNIVGIGGIT
ncbi:hypothetical protein CR513_05471, partial [Mucuna pruriens]